MTSGNAPAPLWGNDEVHGGVGEAEEQRASVTCSRSIRDPRVLDSKLPVLIIIDYVFVNNCFFFKAGENELSFYERKSAFVNFCHQ